VSLEKSPQYNSLNTHYHPLLTNPAVKRSQTNNNDPARRYARLQQRFEQLCGLVDSAPVAIVKLDNACRIVSATEHFRRITGSPVNTCIGSSVFVYFTAESQKTLTNELLLAPYGEARELKVTFKSTVTDTQHYLAFFSHHKCGGDRYTVLALTDASKRIKVETQLRNTNAYLEKLANHDPLTGLSNRLPFNDALRKAMQQARISKRKIALLYFDLDGFKHINDQHGHLAGDTLLREMANRLRKRVGNDDQLARVGGDEFNLFIEYTGSIDSVMEEANQILRIVKQPIQLQRVIVSVSCSIGISIYPDKTIGAQELINQADAAMYQAKGSGRDRVSVFSSKLKSKLRRQRDIESDRQSGIDQSKFDLKYQCIVDAATRQCELYQVLAHWEHPTIGQLSPAEVLSITGRSAEILNPGYWMFEHTCKRLASLSGNASSARLAINISPIVIGSVDNGDFLLDCLEQHALTARNIEFEITESSIINDPDKCARLAKKLQAHGFSLSIDRFGSHHASLSRLVDLPVSKLKIDRALTSKILRNKRALAITSGITRIAHDLGIRVVAEGIDTQAQADTLSGIGCDLLQGSAIEARLSHNELLTRLTSGRVINRVTNFSQPQRSSAKRKNSP